MIINSWQETGVDFSIYFHAKVNIKIRILSKICICFNFESLGLEKYSEDKARKVMENATKYDKS